MSGITDCAACPLRRRSIFIPMTPQELDYMRTFKSGEKSVDRGETVLREGERSEVLYTVLSGMATRSVLLPNGRRQVINFAFPGDFLGLQGGLMQEGAYTVQAASPMTLCVFPRARLWELFRDQPERAYDLTWIAAVEQHFLGETIATLGQRDAGGRLAWALFRIWRRLTALGMAREGVVPFPFRQHDLADALGLSLVHTNKTVARLRRDGLAIWTPGRLRVTDPRGLADLADIVETEEEQRPIL